MGQLHQLLVPTVQVVLVVIVVRGVGVVAILALVVQVAALAARDLVPLLLLQTPWFLGSRFWVQHILGVAIRVGDLAAVHTE